MKKIILDLENEDQFKLDRIITLKSYNLYTSLNNNENEIFLENELYDFGNEKISSELIKEFFENDLYYIVNLKFEGYKLSKNSRYNKIKNEEDFKACDCEFIIRVFDVYYMEIILKDEIVAENIYGRLMANKKIKILYYEDLTEEDNFETF